ncbi:MAG TPA: DinB family protein [Thermoanaerobaculia bacterium]|nr:DinB family protein [Thermoanaerobaculia bacterium]
MDAEMKLDQLSEFIPILQNVAAIVPESLWRRRARDGRFAFVEHLWHLADLEEEFGRRIERLLVETNPVLADFPGERIALLRRYIDQEGAPALDRYRHTRAANIQLFADLRASDWSRGGAQEQMGEVTIESVLYAMLQHDIAHANDLVALLPELGAPVSPELAGFAERSPLARSA